jgi:hypothetical protein
MMKHGKKLNENPALRSCIIVFIIIIGYTIYTIMTGGNSVGFTWKDTYVEIAAPDTKTVTILYDDIKSVEIEENLDYGECIDGGKNRTWNYGTWENNRWESYQLFVKPKLEKCIVLTKSDDSVIVINSESDKVTSSIYENLLTIISASE